MKKQFFLIFLLILLFSCFPAVSAQEDSWTCINGHEGNTGKFCTECGAPRPAAEETWTCINGHEGNTGKFCSECGAPKNAGPVPAGMCREKPQDPCGVPAIPRPETWPHSKAAEISAQASRRIAVMHPPSLMTRLQTSLP